MTGLSTLSCPSCEEGLLLEPGTLVDGRYEIQAHLGKGGMGTVFRARDRDLEQNVAIKFLRTSRHPQAAARFKAEIRLARKVKHENVCPIWQNGYLDGLAYFVMELVEGRTLRNLVQDQGPLSAEEACGLVLQAAAGLRAIHEAGVIHRDVKSPNLMLDTRGVVRVVDFGIAKGDPSQPGPDLTLRPKTDTDQVVGSPEYMSPEQVRGLPLDARTDIYSLGIVLYELCVGRVPFRGTSAFETMMMQVQQAPPLHGPAVLNVAPDLLPILRRALAKDREQRYPTMRALLADLRRAHAAAQGAGTATYPRERSEPRRREVYALLAGLAIGGAALLLSEFCRGEVGPSSAVPATPGPATISSPSARVEFSGSLAIDPSPRAEDSAAPRRDEEDRRGKTSASSPAKKRAPQPGNTLAISPEPAPQAPSDPPSPAGSHPGGIPEGQAEAKPAVPEERSRESSGVRPPSPPLSPPADEASPRTPPVCERCPVSYPPALERAGIEGTVKVRILVNQQGRVEKAEVIGTVRRELREAALATVASWVYRPATRGGVPVPSSVDVPITFRLGSGSS